MKKIGIILSSLKMYVINYSKLSKIQCSELVIYIRIIVGFVKICISSKEKLFKKINLPAIHVQ